MQIIYLFNELFTFWVASKIQKINLTFQIAKSEILAWVCGLFIHFTSTLHIYTRAM